MQVSRRLPERVKETAGFRQVQAEIGVGADPRHSAIERVLHKPCLNGLMGLYVDAAGGGGGQLRAYAGVPRSPLTSLLSDY